MAMALNNPANTRYMCTTWYTNFNYLFSFVPELKGIMATGLDYAKGGEKELENIIQDTKRFPKLLRRLKPQDVEEDRRLQGSKMEK